MPAQQPHFSPKQVALALQASESSVKRWCDQGAISTIRTVGGHRKIPLDALQQFLRSTNRSLSSPEQLGLASPSPTSAALIPGGLDRDQQLFRAALAKGDEETCRGILRGRVVVSGSRSEAADFLVTDAMHGFGEAWNCNQIDVYQERRGCEICIRLINELRSELPALPKLAPVAIGGTLSGDPYQLPTALVELTLREGGWNAISLGSNLPVESYLRAVEDLRPRLVWISVSNMVSPDAFVEQHNRLADQLGDDVSLMLGGRVLTDPIRARLRYTVACQSMRDLQEYAYFLRLNL